MYVKALEPSRCGHCLDWHGSLLLEEVAGEDLLPEDRVRLKDMVDCEDSQPCCPRVALGVGGGLWSAALVRTTSGLHICKKSLLHDPCMDSQLLLPQLLNCEGASTSPEKS